MSKLKDYGPKLSSAEYQKRIVSLYSGKPPLVSEAEDIRLRRQELELTIDHRLGVNFPPDRREALWKTQQRIEKKRIQMALEQFTLNIVNRAMVSRGDQLASYLFKAYAEVLTPAELEAFFALDLNEKQNRHL